MWIRTAVAGGIALSLPLTLPPTNTRTQIMMRALAFFYHMSLSLLFTVWAELLLNDFNGDYGKASDFLG